MIGGAHSAEAFKPFGWSEAELNLSSARTDRLRGLFWQTYKVDNMKVPLFRTIVLMPLFAVPAMTMAATEQAVYFTTKKGKATVYLPDVKHYSTGDRYKATLERKGNTNVFLLKSVEKKHRKKLLRKG